MAASPESTQVPDATDAAWAKLLGIAGRAGATGQTGRGIDAYAPQWLRRDSDGAWQIAPHAPAHCEDLLSLYLPLCARGAQERWVVAHLGQSLDGCIATRGGDSFFVTGHENIVHLHRMRALCDAVVVGAGTVASDDPRLTTRLVPGPNPVRVVLDPRRRLADGHRVFHDGAAPTLLCVADGHVGPAPGQAELLHVPAGPDGLRLDALVAMLAARRLRRLFVEGGGVTVSRFLDAGLLSRLQIAVAPLLIGEGRPGVRLPPTERLADALRLAPRLYRMGADVFYDVDLSNARAGEEPRTRDDGPPRRLS